MLFVSFNFIPDRGVSPSNNFGQAYLANERAPRSREDIKRLTEVINKNRSLIESTSPYADYYIKNEGLVITILSWHELPDTSDT